MKRCLECEHLFQDDGWRCPSCGHVPQFDIYPVFAPELAYQNETYDASYHTTLAELERGHFWFEARNRLLMEHVQEYFAPIENFLEIGCGTGFVLENMHARFSSASLHGSDLLVQGLHYAAQRVPSARLMQMDVRSIPYRDEFDLIGAFDVIEHVDEDEAVLAQMYSAVKPGGGIMITVPQHNALWSAIDDLSLHKRRYSKAELVRKVQGAGFEVLKTTSFVSLLLPFMLAARRRKANADDDFDLFAEFKLNPIVNRGLSAVMSAELALMRAGLRFRFGGSRLILAKRPLQG